MATDPAGARTAERIAGELRAAEYTLLITLPGTPEHTVAVAQVERLTQELLDVMDIGRAHDGRGDAGTEPHSPW